MTHTRCILKMNSRGTVTIPRELRRGLSEDTLFEAIRHENGVIELRPQAVVDAEQQWFWTARWQQMEREADADIAAGRYKIFDNLEGFLADLNDDVTNVKP